MAAVAQKYKVELDPRYKLPKMKYKGNTVQIQRIRKKNQSKIQELPGGGAGAGGSSGSSARAGGADPGGPQQPSFCIFYSWPDRPALADGFSAEWGSPADETE